MLIVLEGVDGAGKSTLAERLCQAGEKRQWETEVWHRGPLERDWWSEYIGDLYEGYPVDPEERVRTLIICDRWHLGEMVYGPLYRGRSAITFDDAAAVNATIDERGGVQLILSPPLATVEQRLRSRGEDFLKPADVSYVWMMYECLGHLYRRDIKILREDLDDNDIEVLLDIALCRTQRMNRKTIGYAD